MGLEIRGLTVRFPGLTAVDDLDLDARDGEVVCVLGPSGCGKSTLLRAIAGLEQQAGGRIHLDGRPLDGLRPDRRGVGLMFQDHALFPHRTVAQNVAFGPRMRGLGRSQVTERVAESLAMVDLEGYGDRDVAELSGGERQRVALARAVAPRPGLLMLDEPLGSLDRALRDLLIEELPRLFARLGTTVLYVTHDHDEALALADRVAVMRAGRLEQVDEPGRLWREPGTEFVARFLGLEPILDAEVVAGTATTGLGPVPAPGVEDGPRRLVLLPDALRLLGEGEDAGPDEVRLAGAVEHRRFAGDHVVLRVRAGDGLLLSVPVWRGEAPPAGTPVTVGLDPTGVRAVRPRDG